MTKLKYKAWDSANFKKKIGEIHTSDTRNDQKLITQLNSATSECYDLIYVFTDSSYLLPESTLQLFNGKLVDVKLIFARDISITKDESTLDTLGVVSYNKLELEPIMVNLALRSGQHSRFNTDPDFGREHFETLYIEWLTKSLSRELASEVFVHKNEDGITGFVTVSIDQNNIGKIGLIAVDDAHQGEGIGSKLLNASIAYLQDNKIEKLHIPTQKWNTGACKFYFKNNFTIISEQNIYHLYL